MCVCVHAHTRVHEYACVCVSLHNVYAVYKTLWENLLANDLSFNFTLVYQPHKQVLMLYHLKTRRCVNAVYMVSKLKHC